MIRVGLTGTLGAGKSTVADLFEEWGARRVDTDRLSREAVAPGQPALGEIRDRWGPAVASEDGGLDRDALREIVTRDPAARRELEKLLHPEIRRLMEEELRRAEEEGVEVAVVEVPLLFENGLEDRFDVTVAVDAPRTQRLERVREERDLPEAHFASMESAQWSGERKAAAADLAIENDGSLEELEAEARRVWERIPEVAGGEGR